MDFSSHVIFQCRLSHRVFTAPVCSHVCSDLCAGSKSPALPAIYHRLDTQIMAHATQSTFIWTPRLWHTLLSQPSFGHPNYGTHYSVNLHLDTQIMAHTTQSTFVWTPKLWHTLLSQPSKAFRQTAAAKEAAGELKMARYAVHLPQNLLHP